MDKGTVWKRGVDKGTVWRIGVKKELYGAYP